MVMDAMVNQFWDHLHIRGEYLDRARVPAQGRRITSTYVENTVSSKDSSFSLRDHLHIRGEY